MLTNHIMNNLKLLLLKDTYLQSDLRIKNIDEFEF